MSPKLFFQEEEEEEDNCGVHYVAPSSRPVLLGSSVRGEMAELQIQLDSTSSPGGD